MRLTHKFVKFIPDEIEEGVLYISLEYATVIHKCICGCKNDVITPLSPTDWQFTYDGETVSLYPSIGNWGFKCQSHYWIKNSVVRTARKWSKEEISKSLKQDVKIKKEFYSKKKRKD